VDLVVFPRAGCREDTYRPPYFHRNIMAEFMGLVRGIRGQVGGFVPGGTSLHNTFASHGNDAETYEKAARRSWGRKMADTLAFMLETRWTVRLTRHAAEAEYRQADYDHAWAGLKRTSSTAPRRPVTDQVPDAESAERRRPSESPYAPPNSS